MKIGRNDPCPCGSGVKFKKCCMGKAGIAEDAGGASAVMDDLKELLKGQTFASLDEANAFVGRYMQQRNQSPVDDFHGLSSEQTHRLLNFPFETPQLVTFPNPLAIAPHAPIVSLFSLLAEGIGDKGLKPTATGNLPRTFCREVAKAYHGEEGYLHFSRFGELRSETEFKEMHVTRLVAELAGLIRKYNGKFILGRECRQTLAEEGLPGIYPLLFRAYATKYNWGYQDHYQELPFIQQSFLFSLYLLTRYGGDWKSNSFYEDSFLEAFPGLLSQVHPMGIYVSPEEVLRGSYSLRCLERFAQFMGLVELERPTKDRYSQEFQLRKLPLLDQVVQFHLS